MRDDYGDQNEVSRPRVREQRTSMRTIPMEFFETLAGPGGTAYPADGLTPPVNVYYARMLKNVSFPETPGAQTLTTEYTDAYRVILNLEPDKYIEVGSVIAAWKPTHQWYTIDKVPAVPQFVTHRKYDFSGNLLWNADHGVRVKSMSMAPSGTLYTVGTDNTIKGWDSAGLEVYSAATGGGEIEVDSSGNIYVYVAGTGITKYDSAWASQWTTNTGARRFAIDSSLRVVACGTGLGAGDDAVRLTSAGALDLTYASSWQGYTAAVSPAGISFFFGDPVIGYLYTLASYAADGSLRWRHDATIIQRLSEKGDSAHITGTTADFAHAGKYRLDAGPISQATIARFDSSGSITWAVNRASAATETCVTVADSGALVLTGGSQTSSITHQARDAADGTLLWERDHGGVLDCCESDSAAVYVGGLRVEL